jgi:hypothetical protein
MGYLIYLNGDLISWKSLTAKTALNSTQSGELLITFHAYRAIAAAAKILASSSFQINDRLIIHTDSKAAQNGLTNEKYELTSAKYLTTKLVQLYQEMHEDLSIATTYLTLQLKKLHIGCSTFPYLRPTVTCPSLSKTSLSTMPISPYQQLLASACRSVQDH